MLRVLCRIYVVLWLACSFLTIYAHVFSQIRYECRQALKEQTLIEGAESSLEDLTWIFFLPSDHSDAARRFLLVAIPGIPVAAVWVLREKEKGRSSSPLPFRVARIAIVALGDFLLFALFALAFGMLWISGERRAAEIETHLNSNRPSVSGPTGEDDAFLGTGLPNAEAVTTSIDGARWSSSDGRGKVVLLDFWASWCAPCIESIPDLKRIGERFAGVEEFEIVTVSLDESAETALQTSERYGIPGTLLFEQGAGFKNSLARAYRVSEIPHTEILVDGVVSYRLRNLKRGAIEKIETVLAELDRPETEREATPVDE